MGGDDVVIKRTLGVALAALFLGGCGSVCNRAAGYSDVVDSKRGQCELGDTFARPSDAERTASRTACERYVEQCTENDERRLNAYYDCVERVPTCEAGAEQDFLARLVACASNLNELSDACRRARAEAFAGR